MDRLSLGFDGSLKIYDMIEKKQPKRDEQQPRRKPSVRKQTAIDTGK